MRAKFQPLTAREKQLYEVLVEHAKAGKSCPSNTRFADLCNLPGSGSVSKIIDGIKGKGYISYPPGARVRVVTVIELGITTPAAKVRYRRANRDGGVGRNPRTEAALAAAASRVAALAEDARSATMRAVKRDPCFHCGVPYDRHGEQGCKRWIPLG